VSYSNVLADFYAAYVAKEAGIFDQNFLDVDLQLIASTTGLPALLSGQTQIAHIGGSEALTTTAGGGEVVVVANTGPVWPYQLYAGSDIKTAADLKGKKVANWLGGDQYELFAALTAAGMDPTNNKGVTAVQQPFDMGLFLNHQVDAASAMTYNELAQVLETKNAKTGKLHALSELNVIKMQDAGTGMLEDGVFVNGSWIKAAAHQDIAKRFLKASFQGWIYCRDHLADCVNIVLKNGPTLGKGHQTWQMNEINKLIWPAPKGIGVMDPAAYGRTAKIAQQFKVIKKAPTGAYRTDLAKAALAMLKGTDTKGSSYKPATVAVTAGGK